MESVQQSELNKAIKLNEIEVFTADQLHAFAKQSNDEIQKSTGNKDALYKEVADEVKSFKPIIVWDDTKDVLSKSIKFVRAAQIAWDAPTDDISKSRSGTYLNTPENRKAGRVGKRYGENNEIEKGGKVASAGEVRVWNGKKMRKQPNGKWVEVSEHGKTKKEHEESSKGKVPAYKEGDGVQALANKEYAHRKNYEHKELASKLSDKEYDEEELKGERKPKGAMTLHSERGYGMNEVRYWKDEAGEFFFDPHPKIGNTPGETLVHVPDKSKVPNARGVAGPSFDLDAHNKSYEKTSKKSYYSNEEREKNMKEDEPAGAEKGKHPYGNNTMAKYNNVVRVMNALGRTKPVFIDKLKKGYRVRVDEKQMDKILEIAQKVVPGVVNHKGFYLSIPFSDDTEVLNYDRYDTTVPPLTIKE